MLVARRAEDMYRALEAGLVQMAGVEEGSRATAASPRGVRSGLCCFFFRFLAQKPVETFCDWLIYFIFFYPGGLAYGKSHQVLL